MTTAITQGGLSKRPVALIAVLAVTLGISAFATVAISPPAAQAEYYTEAYGGCTYSWGAPCYIWYGGVNYLVTMDPDNAAAIEPGRPTFNGFKRPVVDHVERDVCGTIFAQEGGPQDYGWTCNWGKTVVTYPPTLGYTAIGSGTPYYSIALYDVAGFSNL